MYSYLNKQHDGESPPDITKQSINYSNFSVESQTLDFRFTESSDRYHLELELVGYVKEDFNFYLTPSNDLVLTTDRSTPCEPPQEKNTNIIKHSYCYASALLRKTFRLPKNIVKNEIFVDYKNHILRIDLIKLKMIENS